MPYPLKTATFPAAARVRTGAEYARVFAHARRTSDPLMSLHWLGAETPAKLGLAVSRKVDPNAVGRNRIKRVLRDQFRRLRGQLPGGDFVLVARVGARKADNAQLRETFLRTLIRAGALPAPPAPGTMRPVKESTSSASLSSLSSNTPKPDVSTG
ncbi:MAG: ribonuclease P protein component [Pseudoxanthomonas sp.]